MRCDVPMADAAAAAAAAVVDADFIIVDVAAADEHLVGERAADAVDADRRRRRTGAYGRVN